MIDRGPFNIWIYCNTRETFPSPGAPRSLNGTTINTVAQSRNLEVVFTYLPKCLFPKATASNQTLIFSPHHYYNYFP